MTRPPITDHVFRVYGGWTKAQPRRQGRCAWLGTCLRPAADHISPTAFHQRRRART